MHYERFFNKIKQCRRVATRYDKLAANYLAFVKLASIRIWLRANEATPWQVRDYFCPLRHDYRLTQSTSPVEASTATSIYRPALSRP